MLASLYPKTAIQYNALQLCIIFVCEADLEILMLFVCVSVHSNVENMSD